MNCEMCRNELDQFVLGQPDSALAATVAEHLSNCEACRREAMELEAAWAALPAHLSEFPSEEARQQMRRRVMAALDQTQTAANRADLVRRLADVNAERPDEPAAGGWPVDSARQRRWSYALAASVLVALTLGTWWFADSHRDEQARQAAAERQASARLAERLAKLMQAEGATPTQQFDLAPVGQQPGAVHVAWDQAAGQWHVFALDLPPAPAGSRHYLWLIGVSGEAWNFELLEAGVNVLAVKAKPPVDNDQIATALVTLESTPTGEKPRGKRLWIASLGEMPPQ